MSLDIEIYKSENGRCQIELNGRLDTHTSQKLETCLAGLDVGELPIQILDMQNLNYISSAGLRCIFKAKKVVVAAGGRLLLVNLQPPVKKVLDIIKALPTYAVFASNAELDEYLDKMQKQGAAGH
ncbi:MAG: STAS domain-containing protein [Candidatus Eremiobacteraeota bacterium]|nr:STAS domain-containing protein [Candidatus Eremiobacteraeota bacterium]